MESEYTQATSSSSSSLFPPHPSLEVVKQAGAGTVYDFRGNNDWKWGPERLTLLEAYLRSLSLADRFLQIVLFRKLTDPSHPVHHVGENTLIKYEPSPYGKGQPVTNAVGTIPRRRWGQVYKQMCTLLPKGEGETPEAVSSLDPGWCYVLDAAIRAMQRGEKRYRLTRETAMLQIGIWKRNGTLQGGSDKRALSVSIHLGRDETSEVVSQPMDDIGKGMALLEERKGLGYLLEGRSGWMQCCALTKKGTTCRNQARFGSTTCALHA